MSKTEQIIAKYGIDRQGKVINEIAAEFGVTSATVYYALRPRTITGRSWRTIKKAAALRSLRRLFVGTEKEEITIAEATTIWGRPEEAAKQSVDWLRDRLKPLKYYQFAEPVYATRSDFRSILAGIRLTERGKQALTGAVDTVRAVDLSDRVETERGPVLFEMLLDAVKQYERENTSVKITLTVA